MMKLHVKKLALCTIPLMLSACSFSSLSTMDCFSDNWKNIGYQDGLVGASKSKFNDYRDTCRNVGKVPNYRQWEEGRKEGLKYYCTLDNIKRFGTYSYSSICSGYHSSSHHYSSSLQKRIDRERDKLQSYQDQMDRLRDKVNEGYYSPRQAHSEMQRLEKKIEYYEAKIDRHMRQLAHPVRSDDDDD